MQKQINFLEGRSLKGKKALDSIPPESIEKYKTELNKIVEDIQARGINVILSTYPLLMSPDNLDMYPEIFLDNRRFAIDLSYEGMIDASLKGDSIVKETAQQYGTALIDSHDKIPANTDYFADNIHLTDAGAELMAAYMATHILSNYEKYWDVEPDTISLKQ